MQSAVEEFVSRTRAALGENLLDVRLFGSRARGDSQPDSDIDIALIVEAVRRQAEDVATDIAFDINVASSAHVRMTSATHVGAWRRSCWRGP